PFIYYCFLTSVSHRNARIFAYLSKVVEKQYTFGDLPVRVEITDGLVRIVNDRPFKQAVVTQPEAVTSALVDGVKADYKLTFGRDLNIYDESFIVEIWGHLYGDYLLVRYRRALKIILIFGLYDRFR